jgi:hypothetical protein
MHQANNNIPYTMQTASAALYTIAMQLEKSHFTQLDAYLFSSKT